METWSLLELAAAALGLAGSALATRQLLGAWPVALMSSVGYVIVMLHSHLPGQACMSGLAIILQLYGWFYWQHDSGHVHSCGSRGLVAWGGIVVLGALALQWVPWGSQAPVLDSGIFCLGAVSQWLMARRIIECWLGWMLLDALSVYLFVITGLWFTAGLCAIFLFVAFRGWREWLKSLRADESVVAD